MRSRAVFGALAVMSITAGAYATNYYVAPWGDDANNGLSWETAMRSPELVPDKAGVGSAVMINISNGVYRLTKPIFLGFTYGGNGIVSYSGNPKDVILDGQGQSNCVQAEGYSGKFIGITFCNGRYDGGTQSGGAGLAALHEWITLRDCVFSNCWCVAANRKNYSGGFSVGPGSTVSNVLVTGCGVLNTGTTGDAFGGGCYLYSHGNNLTVARELTVTNCAVVGPSAYGGGVFNWFSQMYDCKVVDNVATNGAVGTTADGGGIYCYAFDGNWEPRWVMMSNVLVRCNSCGGNGAGIYGHNRGTNFIDSCTIEGNRVLNGGNGGGAYFNSPTVVKRTLIAENVTTNVAGKGNGGGIFADKVAATVRLEDCVIRDNIAGLEGGGVNSQENFVSISNCVLCGNSSVTRIGAFRFYDIVGGGLITDCFVLSNRAPHMSIGTVGGSAANLAPIVLRNSYFSGNTGETRKWFGSLMFNQAGSSSSARVEYCTFVSNGVNSTISYVLYPDADNPGSTAVTNNQVRNLFVSGCVFHGNAGNLPNNFTIFPDHLTYTYVPTLQTAWQAPELYNLWSAVATPVFNNEAALDFSHGAGSPLIDAGPADVPSWMGTGRRRNGPMDMGDGSYTIGKIGDYGVTVQRHNARPRLSGGIPDLGCFEFFMPPGLMLLLR